MTRASNFEAWYEARNRGEQPPIALAFVEPTPALANPFGPFSAGARVATAELPENDAAADGEHFGAGLFASDPADAQDLGDGPLPSRARRAPKVADLAQAEAELQALRTAASDLHTKLFAMLDESAAARDESRGAEDPDAGVASQLFEKVRDLCAREYRLRQELLGCEITFGELQARMAAKRAAAIKAQAAAAASVQAQDLVAHPAAENLAVAGVDVLTNDVLQRPDVQV